MICLFEYYICICIYVCMSFNDYLFNEWDIMLNTLLLLL